MRKYLPLLLRGVRLVLIVGGILFIHDSYQRYRSMERASAAAQEFTATLETYAEFRERGTSFSLLEPDPDPPPGAQCYVMSFAAFTHFQREADLARELHQASVVALRAELAQPVSNLAAIELYYNMRNWSISYSRYLRAWMFMFEPHLGTRFCSNSLPEEPPGIEL